MKLIAIDLDGTLLSPDGTISKENKDAILFAQKNNCHVAICTGRSFKDAEHIVQKAGLDCSILASNGAIAHYNGRIIQNRTLPTESTKDLIALLNSSSFYFEIYTSEGIILHENSEAMLNGEIQDLQERGVTFPVDFAHHMIQVELSQYGIQFIKNYDRLGDSLFDINKILALSFDEVKLNKMYRILKNRTDISVTNSAWCNIDIGHLDSNKGVAVKEMASYLNIPIKNTITIGDNFNDVSMFQISGMSIAMGNAKDEIKRGCTHTTLSCEENGVAHAIEEIILKQCINV